MHRTARSYVLCAFLVTALLPLVGCSSSKPVADSGFVAGDGSIIVLPADQRQPAPNFTGTTLDGTPLSLRDTSGKVTVVNVWASWCGPCRSEAPSLEAVWKQYDSAGTVQFLGLNTRDSPTSARTFVQKLGITYPSIVDSDGQIQLLFRDTLPPQAIPSTVIIDAEGRVAARALGVISESSLRGLIEPLVTEKTLATEKQ